MEQEQKVEGASSGTSALDDKLERKWCSYCGTDTHGDAECWSTRPRDWQKGLQVSKCEKCGYDTTIDGAHHCGPMTSTSAMPRDMRPVSVEALTRAMQEIDLLPELDQWIVIDPQGRMYKGTVEQMTRLLLHRNPLLQMPLTMPANAGIEAPSRALCEGRLE